MMLHKIRLQGFRNFEENLFEFSPDTTIVVGPNAAGKTNLLEAIHLIATGKSFKARVEQEMINHNSELSRVKSRIVDKKNKTDLEVILTRGEINSERVPKKKLLVEGVPKRLIDFAANLKTVLFSPEDLELVLESPSIRRKFLDSVLSQVNYEYRKSLLIYEKGLRRRNRLLISIREEGAPRSHLHYWDKLLIKNGDFLTTYRQNFLSYVNGTDPLNETKFVLDYDKSIISQERIEQYAIAEVSAGTTLVGPHRDDFVFKITREKENRELASFGSRGEQRMGVLWLKLAELAFIEEETKETPILLLDDIFSELDHSHREIVKKATKKYQTIITTADPHFVEDYKKVEKINLQ